MPGAAMRNPREGNARMQWGVPILESVAVAVVIGAALLAWMIQVEWERSRKLERTLATCRKDSVTRRRDRELIDAARARFLAHSGASAALLEILRCRRDGVALPVSPLRGSFPGTYCNEGDAYEATVESDGEGPKIRAEGTVFNQHGERRVAARSSITARVRNDTLEILEVRNGE